MSYARDAFLGAAAREERNCPDVSVVVPVLNAAGTLRDLLTRICAVFSKMDLACEVIFIDDGSRDDSWRVISQLTRDGATASVRGLRLAKNSGQQAATLCGLERARGKWVLTLDDDLQTPPEEFPKLWQAAQVQQSDLVYGVCPTPRHNLWRNLGSRLFHWLARGAAPAIPAGSSFRLIKADLLASLDYQAGAWAFVDPALSALTSEIATITVRREGRQTGKSGYSPANLLQLATTVLVIHSTLPLHLLMWGGLISALGSFCLGIYFLFLKLTTNVPVGFSALIVTMTFGFGLTFMSFGILGIYIARIYLMGTGRPAYRVRAEI